MLEAMVAIVLVGFSVYLVRYAWNKMFPPPDTREDGKRNSDS